MRLGRRWQCALALAVIGATAPSQADTVQLNPSKDNTLYEDDAGGTTSNGQGQHFFVGPTSQGLRRRGVIAFDIAGNIPAGAMIESVTLTLHASSSRDTPEIQIDLHAALADWGEGASIADAPEGQGAPAQPGDATWMNTFYPDQFWVAEGGDYSSAVTASAAVSSVGFFSFDSTFDAGLVTDIQQWLDQPETNFGWILVAADEHFTQSAKRFDSRKNAEPTFQPALTVTYSFGASAEVEAAGATPWSAPVPESSTADVPTVNAAE